MLNPDACYTIGQVAFRVYIAKEPYTSHWRDQDLFDLVAAARQTYRVYNDAIPSFDEYDQKAIVYVASARYHNDETGHDLEEWVSLRFIPLAGEPSLSQDLTLSGISKDGQWSTLIDRVSTVFYDGDHTQTVRDTWSISRFCALRPQEVKVEQDGVRSEHAPLFQKNRNTALCFAVINLHFLSTVRERKMSVGTITAQMNTAISNQVLVYTDGTQRVPLLLPFAQQTLACTADEDIRLLRTEYWEYLYSYPGYFLDVQQLVHCLELCMQEGVIERSLIDQLLPAGITWEQCLRAPHFSYLKEFGTVLTSRGVLNGAHISGEDLRMRIDASVDDAVFLHCMRTTTYEQSLQTVVDAGKKRD